MYEVKDLKLFLGMGIFVLSGQAAALYSGPSLIISFIVTGIVALLSAISFSELAAMMSVSAAAYTYTYAGQLLIVFLFSCYKWFFLLFQL
jgi:amino acid transporter